MENNYKDENDTKKPQKEDSGVDDLKEAMREMKQEFRDQMRGLKDELSEIKEEPHPKRKPRRPRPSTSFKIDSEGWEDWGERFGESLEHYVGGIMESIGDTLNRSVGSIFSPHKQGKYRGRSKKKERRSNSNTTIYN